MEITWIIKYVNNKSKYVNNKIQIIKSINQSKISKG